MAESKVTLGMLEFDAPTFTDTTIAGWKIVGNEVRRQGAHIKQPWDADRMHAYSAQLRRYKRWRWLPLWVRGPLRLPLEAPPDHTVTVAGNTVFYGNRIVGGGGLGITV